VLSAVGGGSSFDLDVFPPETPVSRGGIGGPGTGAKRTVFLPPPLPAADTTGVGYSSTEPTRYSTAVGRFRNERGGSGGGTGTGWYTTTGGVRAAGGETGTGSSSMESALYSTAVGRFANELPVWGRGRAKARPRNKVTARSICGSCILCARISTKRG
jgi:hypothetical protein